MDWTLIGLILALVAIALLVGAALGYYTAASDLGVERARAWRDGWEAGRNDIEWRNDLMGSGVIPMPYTENPYARGKRGNDEVEPKR